MTAPTSADWHAIDADEALARLQSGRHGLDEADAVGRLARHGPNRLAPPPPRGAFARFLAQFNNVLIYVLIGSGVVTILLGHHVDAAVIFGVVVINAVIGFIQEGRAERALEAVDALLAPRATVIRNGRRRAIDAESLVPGDLVFLQSGDRVPADLRLVSARSLAIDEAILTGESNAADKDDSAVDAGAVLGDRRDMAFSGTLVTAGQGTGVAVATGEATEIGRISTMLAQVRTLTTPLTRQMARFARVLSAVILFVAVLTAVFGVTVHGYALDEMFLAAVGFAVAAVPEGLPPIITITLAIGVQRMAARNAIIRRLPAVETLGSVSVICSDKTGTLTRNEMTVQTVVTADRAFEVSGSGYDPHGGIARPGDGDEDTASDDPVLRALCRAGMLCNDARLVEREGRWRVEGDPMEGALIVLGRKIGLEVEPLHEQMPRDDVIPFDAEHKFMATLHHDHAGGRCIYVKGAPEVLFSRCRAQQAAGGEAPLDAGYWQARLDEITAVGQRALAVAVRDPLRDEHTLTFTDLDDGLVLLGVVGIMDPPREEAVDAVAECRQAGIAVKMITGDHADTAVAIAGRMGIATEGGVLGGADLDGLDDDALYRRALEVDVFARTTPAHKLRLVEALQAHGRVVAMTGDGVNDAPALKRADVGVAMGVKGTDAAKGAAEMVLADDNFASITLAVREGRTVYDNIRKSILFILPTSGGEALTILAAVAFGITLPVTAVQILWVNMITAVTLALSLAFEAAEEDLMKRPPRPADEPLVGRFMAWRIVFVSVLMVAGAFGLFLWELETGASVEAARTVAVNALVAAEAFYLLNSRSLVAPVLNRRGLAGNPYVLLAVATVAVFQVLFTYVPLMQTFFGTADIGIDAWGRIVLFGIALLLLVEAEKALVRRR